MNKIVASLPPSYNNIILAWANVDNNKQTMENLSSRLFWQELVLKMWGEESTSEDTSFFTMNSRFQGSASSSGTRKFTKTQQREWDEEYVRELKTRTKCFDCWRKGHWSNKCLEPVKHNSKTRMQTSAANLVEENTSMMSTDDKDCCAFIVVSHVMIARGNSNIWYADIRESKHMTDRRNWFSTLEECQLNQDSILLWSRGGHSMCKPSDTCVNGVILRGGIILGIMIFGTVLLCNSLKPSIF
jgi:hypothetical protein